MPVIELIGLHKSYGDTVAVDDVSFTVQRGEIFGILGRNGAGKTTTVESIAGLRQPDRGVVRVLGLDPFRDRARIRQVLGVQLQASQLHGQLTVAELMRLYRSFYRRGADPDVLLNELGLHPHRNQQFDNLSGGQQQRLSIAVALIGSPRVAILDELTTGLDPEARRETWRLVEQTRDRGVTIVLVTHLMEEAQRLCDRIAIIDRGRVLALDTPAGLIAEADVPQRVTFRTTEPLNTSILQALADVTDVVSTGARVVVTGNGDLLRQVSETLIAHQVVALQMQREQVTLDDAFLTLTGRAIDADHLQTAATALQGDR